jgi:hypothetical protein
MQQFPLVEVIQFRGPPGLMSAVRSAAERAGKSAPEWLREVVAERAHETGVNASRRERR